MKTLLLFSATLLSSLHLSSGLAKASSPDLSVPENKRLLKDQGDLKLSANSVEIQTQSSLYTVKPAFSSSKPTAPSVVPAPKALGIPAENTVGPRPGTVLPTAAPETNAEPFGVGPRPGSKLSPEVVDDSSSDAVESSESSPTTSSSIEDITEPESGVSIRPGGDLTVLVSETREDIAEPNNVGPRPGSPEVLAQAGESNDTSIDDVTEVPPATAETSQPPENFNRPVPVRESTANLPTSIASNITTSPATFVPETLQITPDEDITLLDLEKLAYKLELEDVDFLCQTKNGVPATVAKLKDEDELLVVLWNSKFFTESGYDPDIRCEQVSARFDEFLQAGSSAYITKGELNNQPVICLTNSEKGDCGEGIPLHNGLLFTLKPNEDSQKKLEQLVSILKSPEVSDEQEPLKE